MCAQSAARFYEEQVAARATLEAALRQLEEDRIALDRQQLEAPREEASDGEGQQQDSPRVRAAVEKLVEEAKQHGTFC